MRYIFFLPICILTACSPAPVELPEVPALEWSEKDADKLHGNFDDIDVRDSGLKVFESEDGDISFRLVSPADKGIYPLLVFSHGNWSSEDKYQGLIRFWAANGYIVLTLNHDDCCGMASGIYAALRYGNVYLLQQRTRDIESLLQAFPSFQSTLPEGVLPDMNSIALTGHSFGAFTAQMFAGARIYNPDTAAYEGADISLDLSGVKAIVSVSPPGPMFDEITAQSWDGINKPMLVTTGTWDVEPRFFPEYQLHQMSFDKAPAGDRYSLLIQGADHYFGNLICRPEREVTPQHLQFEMLKSATLQFLDAYLKSDPIAMEAIKADQLGYLTQNFATIQHK